MVGRLRAPIFDLKCPLFNSPKPAGKILDTVTSAVDTKRSVMEEVGASSMVGVDIASAEVGEVLVTIVYRQNCVLAGVI